MKFVMVVEANIEYDEKRRSLDTPATRMFANPIARGPTRPSSQGSHASVTSLEAVNAVLEKAKSLRLQQRAMLEDRPQVVRTYVCMYVSMMSCMHAYFYLCSLNI